MSGSGAFSKGPVGIGGSGDATDPTAYLASVVILGNGQGFSTERPQFGLPAGGQADWRAGVYIGDTWKIRPTLTVNYGIRYSRDTGRSDSDLPPVPCSDAVTTFGDSSPCTTGNLMDALTPGLGKRVRQPNNNWGPKGGFAWDLKGNGKTVVAADSVFTLRTAYSTMCCLIAKPASPRVCSLEIFNSLLRIAPRHARWVEYQLDRLPRRHHPDPRSSLGRRHQRFGPCFAALQTQYQSITKQGGASANGVYLANTLTESADTTGTYIYAPNYRTARSLQMNIGVQREVWKGGILSVDYLRNVGTHSCSPSTRITWATHDS